MDVCATVPQPEYSVLPDEAAQALRENLAVVNALCGRDWMLGGGTVLAAWLRHRKSQDTDVFVSAQSLRRWREEGEDALARPGLARHLRHSGRRRGTAR